MKHTSNNNAEHCLLVMAYDKQV